MPGTLHTLPTAGSQASRPDKPAPALLSESQLSVLPLALDDATSPRAIAFSSRCGLCDRSARRPVQ